MPGLAFRLADLHQRESGERIYAALYRCCLTFYCCCDEALVLAIIRKDQAFTLGPQPRQAAGLMQLMPATAAFISRDERYHHSHRHKLHNPVFESGSGTEIYRSSDDGTSYQKGDLVRMLAAYNGGPGNLNKWLRSLTTEMIRFFLIESISA